MIINVLDRQFLMNTRYAISTVCYDHLIFPIRRYLRPSQKFDNISYRRKKLDTQSIVSSDLSVILANRSAALYHMGQHERSLDDIREAIRLKYPEELRYKIEERRARCFLALKMNAKAIDYFRIALKSLDQAKITDERKYKLETDIRVMLTLMDKGERINAKAKKSSTIDVGVTAKNVENFIPKIDKPNPLYPACSNAVEIRDDGGDVGRHAVANRIISPGEFLIVERPHCALLLAEYR